MTKKNNYSNLIANIQREREEVNEEKKIFDDIDRVLARKYNIKRPPYVREGISATQEEINLTKEIRGRLAQYSPEEIPNKSQIWRAGLHILNKLNTQEIYELIKTLN